MITHTSCNIEDWIEFSRVNLLSKMKKTLEKGCIQNALLIWVRHQAELKNSINKYFLVFFLDSYFNYWKFVNFSLKFTLKLLFFSDEVNSILNCIPNHSSIDTKLQFLKQFIPDILKLNPGSLTVVASWTLATVRLLELERKDWPENGLKFAQEVICSL